MRSPARSATVLYAADAGAPASSNAATRAPASSSASTHTGPSLPQAPVTTAVWLSSRKIESITTRPGCNQTRVSVSRPRELCARLAQHLEREEIVFVNRLQRHPAEHVIEFVRRDPAARRLHHDVIPGQHVAGREIADNDQALAHLDDGRLLALVDLLVPVAERLAGALEIANHLSKADRLERKRMVGPLHRPVEGEMLFDDAGAEHVGRHRHRDAVVVAGIANDRARKPLAILADHPEIELLERRRIAGGALQDAELRINRHDRVVGPLHVIDQGAAGRDDDRLAERGDVLEQRRALDVAGRDLERRHVELAEKVRAGDIERGCKEVDPELAGVLLQLAVLGGAELEKLTMLPVGGAKTVFVVVRLVVGDAGVEPAVVALLQLDRMRTRELGLAEQLARLVETALVIVPDLRDHVARRVIAELVRANSESSCHAGFSYTRTAGRSWATS